MAEQAEKAQPEKTAKAAKPTQTTAPNKKKQAAISALPTKPVTDPFAVVSFVLMTEKAIRLIESQNKLVFVVRKTATKEAITSSVETLFAAKIAGVETLHDQKGRKHAYVKFKEAGAAGDIAVRLGII